MNIFQIQKTFNTKAKCIKHLEKVRWAGKPVCVHCESDNVTKKKSRKFYYRCNKCRKDFTVLFGTIFEASKLPLPKWFMLIGLILNARKGISSMELHRHLGVTYKTAWYSAMRVRCAMVDQISLLEGIIEMDEAYIGGKPRKRGKKEGSNVANLSTVTFKRGRGTKKVPVVAIVEREGKKRVVTEVAGRLTSKNMLAMLKKYVNTEKAIAMTDEARFYHQFEKELQHLIVTHSKGEYVRDIVHTNTVEGFFSIIKNGIRGEYYVLSKKYLPFYLAEFAYKYNRRSKEDKKEAFGETITNAVNDVKCLVEYKPKGNVEKIAYGDSVWKEAPKKPKHKVKRKKKMPPVKKRTVRKKQPPVKKSKKKVRKRSVKIYTKKKLTKK